MTAFADENEKKTEGSIIQSKFKVRDEELVRDGYRAFLSKIDTVAKELETQKEKIVISTMKKSTEATGNVVSAKGEPFTPRLIIDALSKMEIEFNKEGKFQPPVLVVSPQLAKVISKRAADWEKDLGYAKAFAELVEKKRREWRDRENSRKLVD